MFKMSRSAPSTPLLPRATVTLESVVKVRKQFLKEYEAWAVLCQAVQAIQDLFLNGKRNELACRVDVTPSRIELTPKGRVRLAPTNSVKRHIATTDTLIEKMLIYNLGRSLQTMLGPNPDAPVLGPVLEAATSPDVFARASLMYLLDVISEYCGTRDHTRPFSHIIMDLYQAVGGKEVIRRAASTLTKPGSQGGHNMVIHSSSEGRSSDDEVKTISRRTVYRQNSSGAKYCGPNTVIGPEFIVRSQLPPKQIVLVSNKNTNLRKVLVLLLDGKRLEVSCNPNSTTFGQIFKLVVDMENCEYIATLGLACLLQGDFVTPPQDTKLSKLCPPLWLSQPDISFNLYLRFRLYLPSLRGVSSWKWKHMLYLQLRRDLLDRLIICNKNEIRALAGLALQAEFGDYDPQDHGMEYFLLEHYLPVGEECSISELQSLHKQRRGMDPGKAEEMFISHVMYAQGYGTHYFTAQSTSQVCENRKVQVGVNSKGMLLSHGLKGSPPSHSFPWSHIKKLTHTKTSFEIVTSDARHKLRLDKNKSFYLFRLAWLHHKFFMKISNEFTSLQLLSEEFGDIKTDRDKSLSGSPSVMYLSPGKKKSGEPGALRRAATFLSPDKVIFRGKTATHCHRRSESCRETRSQENKRDPLEMKPLSTNAEVSQSSISSRAGRRGVLMGTRAIGGSNSSFDLSHFSNSSLQIAPPAPHPYHVTTISVSHKTSSVSVEPKPAEFKTPLSLSRSTGEAYVLNSSIKSVDEQFEVDAHESISESLAEKMDLMAFTQGRVLTTVTLKRSLGGSLGLQVTEGRDGGVYILSVLSGGPAHKSHLINTGDQIQAVNGTNVLNLPYHEVLRVVELCGDVVELVLSQPDKGQKPSGPKIRNCNTPRNQGLDLLANVLQKPIETSYKNVIRYNIEAEVDHQMMISELPNLSYL